MSDEIVVLPLGEMLSNYHWLTPLDGAEVLPGQRVLVRDEEGEEHEATVREVYNDACTLTIH